MRANRHYLTLLVKSENWREAPNWMEEATRGARMGHRARRHNRAAAQAAMA